jgi:D-alanyl-lipoteichoic acid acyltransferase DltB (MBOAT superfamily)
MPQLQGPRLPTKLQLAEGLHLIVWGVFKKLFVADNLAVLVQRVVDGDTLPNTGAAVWVATYAFAWQIYCDFSGYTDIARGIAKLLGIELSVNFTAPYLAHRPQEIWRRWHISLSQWLRDYLYIPLGGNRLGKARTQLNLMLTMLLGGLWHGANWTYVIWGGIHGVALAIDRLRGQTKPTRWARFIGVVLTFHLSALAFLIFRAPTMERALDLMRIQFTNVYMSAQDRMAFAQLALLVAIPLGVELLQSIRARQGKADLSLVLRWHPAAQAAFTAALVLITLFLGATAGQSFIYYQF